MEEKIQYGFFDQIPVSFFHPGRYKEFLPARKRSILGFVILIVFISFMIECLIPFGAWDVSVGGLENLVSNGIPAFTLKDGSFEMDSPLDITLADTIHLKADSDVEKYTEKDLGEDYLEEFLISKKNMIMKHSNMVYDISFDKLGYTMTNQTIVEMMPAIKATIILSFVLIYLTKIAVYLIAGLFFAIICRGGVRSKEGKRTPFGAAFVFSLYARAPFLLLNDVTDSIGLKDYSMGVMLIGVFLSIRYIFAAERSLLGLNKDSDEDRRVF